MPKSIRIIPILFVFAMLLWVASAVYFLAHGQQQLDCVFGSFGCGHEQNHDKYKGWRRPPSELQPNGMDCCSGGDCRPTKIRGNKSEGYEWWDGEVWVKAPDFAILKTDIIGDGRAHVCAPLAYPGAPADQRTTYCLSPSEPRI